MWRVFWQEFPRRLGQFCLAWLTCTVVATVLAHQGQPDWLVYTVALVPAAVMLGLFEVGNARRARKEQAHDD